MKKYDYLVVGAGLYGAVFANQAKAAGRKVLVVEKRPHIAGNVYTEEMEGIQVHHYGAHIFHTNDRKVWEYITRFADFNRFTNSVRWRIIMGSCIRLPFNMYTFYQMWGVTTPEQAQAKIAEQRKAAGITEPKNLEEQAISLVGTDIYEKLIKGYTREAVGTAHARSFPASLSVVFRCALLLIIITLMRCIRGFRSAVIPAWRNAFWKVSRCV